MRELVDYLPKRPEESKLWFARALIESGQKHILEEVLQLTEAEIAYIKSIRYHSQENVAGERQPPMTSRQISTTQIASPRPSPAVPKVQEGQQIAAVPSVRGGEPPVNVQSEDQVQPTPFPKRPTRRKPSKIPVLKKPQ